MNARLLLLAATLLAAAAPAVMAQPVATFDAQQLPQTKGQVAQYSLTPRGDVDGLILQDGTQVHLPPHLGGQLVQAVKPGDTVTIRGLKAEALPLIKALSVSNDASGQAVVDSGPPVMPPQPLGMSHQWQQAQGRIRALLYGPRGDMNGALLEDGTQIHLPPDQAATLAQDLQPGRTLVAAGYGVAGPYGRSIDARQIGDTPNQLVEVAPPGPRHGHRPPPPGGPGHLRRPPSAHRPPVVRADRFLRASKRTGILGCCG